MHNATLAPKNLCTGCGACYNICPVNAIEMKEDAGGFLYPHINRDKCIFCGNCVNTCPVFKEKREIKARTAYIGQSKRAFVIEKSASGGVFTEIASTFIMKGGMVVGARYKSVYGAEHAICNAQSQLIEIQGSKYIQSVVGDVYQKVQSYLEEGKSILFSGTPCQCEGLKCFLGKEYPNLYTIDLMCHGVGAPQILKINLDQLAEKYGKIIEIEFKCKRYGYSFPTFRISTEKRSMYFSSYNDPFMKGFLNRTITRCCCDTCKYRTYHASDITIGDEYSEVYKKKGIDYKLGANKIVVWSKKGDEILKSCDTLKMIEYKIEGSSKPTFLDARGEKIDYNEIDLLGEKQFYIKRMKINASESVKSSIRFMLYWLGIHDKVKGIVQKIRKY